MSLIEDYMRAETAKTTRRVVAAMEEQAKDPLRQWVRNRRAGVPGPWHIEKDTGLSTYCGIASIFGSSTLQHREDNINRMVVAAEWSGQRTYRNPSFKVCHKCVREAQT